MFASQIHDVILGSLKSKAEMNDPVVLQFVGQMKSESDALALSTIQSADELLAKAITNGSSQSVIDAYERILTRASTRS